MQGAHLPFYILHAPRYKRLITKWSTHVPVKITDVALKAGVSMKTVSRVLNNEPNVTAKTRDKVKLAVKELRYRPNLAARGLAGSRSYLIALLYGNPSSDYIAAIQSGATQICRQKGYHLMVEPLDMSDGDLGADLEMLLGRLPVDGVILTPPLTDSEPLMAVLRAANIAFIRLGHVKATGRAPNIIMDDRAACFEITNHLIDMGHEKIGFIKGDPRHSASLLRFLGYCQAMEKAGLEIDMDNVAEGDYSFAAGQKCAKAILGRPAAHRPTAILASNDNMAAAVYSVAGQLDLSVPDDISICGFDDMVMASVLWPPLTTIGQPVREMGARAAMMLINKHLVKSGDEAEAPHMAGEVVTLPYEIISRLSVKKMT